MSCNRIRICTKSFLFFFSSRTLKAADGSMPRCVLVKLKRLTWTSFYAVLTSREASRGDCSRVNSGATRQFQLRLRPTVHVAKRFRLHKTRIQLLYNFLVSVPGTR